VTKLGVAIMDVESALSSWTLLSYLCDIVTALSDGETLDAAARKDGWGVVAAVVFRFLLLLLLSSFQQSTK
jgi:hypothetical protein